MEFQYFPAHTFPGDVNVRLMSSLDVASMHYIRIRRKESK